MIKTIEPPRSAIQAAEGKMAELIGGQTHGHLNEMSREDLDNTHVTLPHNVYDLRLDSLIAGEATMPTEPVALHLLVGHGDNLSSAMQLDPHATRVIGYQYSTDVVHATSRAIAAAEALPEAKAGEYELRMLRIPALNVSAVWLKDQKGKEDRLVPVAPTDPGFVAHQAYTVDEFLKIARQRASFLYGAKDSSEMGG
ncbi:MAG TPA: hypothetical protein VHE55_06265 [Fimbriimonadaceae bacterium]|nr:hypothetical protein [Fimbriimonadaceae bacterium]